VILKGKTPKETCVSEIMTTEVLFVEPNQSIEGCMALMTTKKVRHLPVLENDELIGIISIGDVVNAIISEKQFVIDQLENYIKGY
jgi:CBS domain-containing protein